MSLTHIQDVEKRKEHYIESLRYWKKIPEIQIVFVENSNTNIKSEVADFTDIDKFEFLTFDGNEYNKSLGKGYGELKCIEYAVLHSKFISEATFIFKVTGRYKVLNFNTFLENFRKEPNIDLLIDFKLNLTFSDSRFFGFTKKFVKDYLMRFESIVNDSEGIYFENILIKAALIAISDGYVYRPLYALPRISGYSGSLGVRYNSSYLHWLRHKVKYYLKYKSIGLGHMPDI